MLLIFLINPFIILLIYLLRGEKVVNFASVTPFVSLITVVHNAEDLIVDKIRNSLSLNYPFDKYDIIIYSDGSTDETENKVRTFNDKRIHFLSSLIHEGKNNAINRSVQNCSGEVLVFSDVGALLESNAIKHLVKCFADSEVGGVCGLLSVIKDNIPFSMSQSDYWRIDRIIKQLESKTGSISSNTGTLYSIRKDLFKPVPQAVTDDLYTCLSVVKQHRRFIFEPNAISYIKARSRRPKHEIERRRRIVCRSLTGIFLHKDLLNPFKYGMFSIRLLINKTIRRFLPIYLLLIFFSSMFLSFYYPFIWIVVFLQFIFYILAFSYPIFFRNIKGFKFMKRITSLAYYFCLGNYGTLLGLIDFIRGKKVVKWEPLKTD